MPSVWLTRSQPLDSNPLAEALARAGWPVTNLPVLTIEPVALNATELAVIQQKIDAADWVLWTSAHAVTALPPELFQSKPDHALHAVGSRTASCAEKHVGRPVTSPRVGHGGAAWVAGMQGQWCAGQQLLIITGENGNTSWYQAVRDAGLALEAVAVYRRRPHRLVLPAETPDAVIATSAAALTALEACQPPAALHQVPIILPAERLNSVARDFGWSGRIANVPDLSPAAVQAALEESR